MMKVTDPVCGMSIEEREAEAQIKHEGKTYFFCSTDCRNEFQKEPKRYVGGTAKTGCCGNH